MITWIIIAILVVIWFVEKFLLGKGGAVHIVLLFAIVLFVSEVAARRRAMQGNR